MRWLMCVILAYLMTGLQAGLAPALTYMGARPNFVLLAVIFIAINAPRDTALLACFVLGLFQDVLSGEPLGLYAFAYGWVGMFTVNTQQFVYREHPLTHFSMVLSGGLITGVILLVHGWAHSSLPAVVPYLVSALYSALVGVVVLGVLQRFRRWFGFRGRDLSAWRASRV